MVDIFISYSHNDLRFKDELKKFLHPLLNLGGVQLWDDYDIEAGKDWEAEIKKNLFGADIILLLVSPDSLASAYFYGKEVAVSLERHQKNEAVVVPIILRPCHWTVTPLAQIEALPEKGKPITSWSSQDEAFTDVAQRLSETVTRLKKTKADQTQRQQAFQNFEAARKAAEHLFQSGRWAEAKQGYNDLLRLYVPGFVPDKAIIQQQIEACTQRERDAITQAQHKKALQDFELARHSAEQLFQEGNWEAAKQAFSELSRLHQTGFVPDKTAIQQQIKTCTQRQKEAVDQAAANKRRAAAEAAAQNRPAPSGDSSTQDSGLMLRYGLIGVVAVVLFAGLLIWKLWEKPVNQPAGTNSTTQSVVPPSDDDAFNKARTINTIPAYNAFLSSHPRGNNAPEARRLLNDLHEKRKNHLNDADVNIKAGKFERARNYLNEASKISPDDPDITERMRQVPARKE
jgi:hypothetical protein